MAHGVFYGKGGKRHEIGLDVTLYKQAAEAGCSVPQYLERVNQDKVDTAAYGSVFNQLLAQNGMTLDNDKVTGLGSAKMEQVLEGGLNMEAAIVRDSVSASRILAPAALLETVEINMAADKSSDVALFEKLIAYNFSLTDDRFEQPVVDFSGNDEVRSKAIAQLALPEIFGRLTVSERQGVIPTFALGLEMSEKAQKAYTFDFVARIIARQASVEKANRVNQHINALVNGDKDTQQAALPKVAAKTFDANAVGKKLTHKAYTAWLRRNRSFRHIDWVLCDLATYFKIVEREGRPTIMTLPVVDNEVSHQLTRPVNLTHLEPQIYIVDDGVIPTDTIVGLDSRWAINRATNLSANYKAIQELVMRRGTEMRFDFGELVFRGDDKAWDVLELTQS